MSMAAQAFSQMSTPGFHSSPMMNGNYDTPQGSQPSFSNDQSAQLKRRIRELEDQLLASNTELKTTKSLYNDLISRLDSKLGSREPDYCSCTTLPTYAKEDYPCVKYWTASSWSKRDKTNGFGGGSENKMCGFMEYGNGDAVDETVMEQVRELARSIWSHFLLLGRAPLTWGDIGVIDKVFYFHTLYRYFPWMALAVNHWKANRLGTDYYSAWISVKSRKTRAENSLQVFPQLANLLPMKREAEDDDEAPSTKKVKREVDDPVGSKKKESKREKEKKGKERITPPLLSTAAPAALPPAPVVPEAPTKATTPAPKPPAPTIPPPSSTAQTAPLSQPQNLLLNLSIQPTPLPKGIHSLLNPTSTLQKTPSTPTLGAADETTAQSNMQVIPTINLSNPVPPGSMSLSPSASNLASASFASPAEDDEENEEKGPMSTSLVLPYSRSPSPFTTPSVAASFGPSPLHASKPKMYPPSLKSTSETPAKSSGDSPSSSSNPTMVPSELSSAGTSTSSSELGPKIFTKKSRKAALSKEPKTSRAYCKNWWVRKGNGDGKELTEEDWTSYWGSLQAPDKKQWEEHFKASTLPATDVNEE